MINYEDYELIKNSGLFNVTWYLKMYPEVIKSGIDPIFHYLIYGVDKRYNPNPNFDTVYYLEKNSDVKNAKLNPLIHYVKYGINEHRVISNKKKLLFESNQIDSILKHVNSKISIIIPIYNAYEETKKCINSIFENTEMDYEIILINDCSSDSRISELLNTLSDLDNVKVIENQINKGFTGTVNVGLLNSSNNDVVLLNSDTIVTKNWLKKLIIAAYSDEKIGTVTPVSNNSGAFSVPVREISNEIPKEIGIDGMANLVEKVSKRIYMDVPTANGFCMYIKRETINDVGLFDEMNFEKGYGEENDYSMRASKKGWKHIIDDSTYIYHKSGASFSEKKIKLMKKHRKILDVKYPDYTEKVQNFINSNELKFIENTVQKGMENYFIKNLNKKRILYVMHNGSGGTRRNVEDLAKNLNSKFDIFFLTSDSQILTLYYYVNNEFKEIEKWDCGEKCSVHDTLLLNFRNIYFNILIKYSIDLIHIHHLIKHSWDIIYISKILNIPNIVSLHDFYLICPCYNLLNENLEFCSGICNNTDKNCLISIPDFVKINNTKSFVKEWRIKVKHLLNNVDSFIIFNNHVEDIYTNIYPQLKQKKFKIIEHGEDFPINDDYHSQPIKNEPIKLLFLGHVGIHKGVDIIKRLYEYDTDNKLEFHFLGKIDGSLNDIGTYHGDYNDLELPHKLKNIKPTFSCIFSTCSETFCYTLSESWNYNIPILTFDIGATGERIRKHGGGWFLDPKDIVKMYKKIIYLSNDIDQYNTIQRNISNIKLSSTKFMSENYLTVYNNHVKNYSKMNDYIAYLSYYNCLLLEKDFPEMKVDFELEPKINLEGN